MICGDASEVVQQLFASVGEDKVKVGGRTHVIFIVRERMRVALHCPQHSVVGAFEEKKS